MRLPIIRRSVLLLALLAALPLSLAHPASAREALYLGAAELDLVSILPPPVTAGSAADREQLAVVLRAQQAASPERIEQAKRDAKESIDVLFGALFGKALDARALPATTRLFARLEESEGAVVGPAKTAFGRVRPYLSNPEIKALVRPSTSGAYPSGHTTYAAVAAILVGDMVPEKRPQLFERAADYAWSRVIAGMHYPNDLDGGRLAGTALVVALRDRPAFKADYEAARRELRAFLGLAP